MTMAPSVSYSITARLEVASHGRAVSESLARESGSGSQLAMALINKAEVYSRRAQGPQDLGPAVILAEAAQLALDDEASAGLRAWIAGERAAQEAELGQELAAGHHLERAYRVSAASCWRPCHSATTRQFRRWCCSLRLSF